MVDEPIPITKIRKTSKDPSVSGLYNMLGDPKLLAKVAAERYGNPPYSVVIPWFDYQEERYDEFKASMDNLYDFLEVASDDERAWFLDWLDEMRFYTWRYLLDS